MSISPITNLSSSYLQSLLGSTLSGTGSMTGTGATSKSQKDHGQLSPFAQLMSTLQQLQQSNSTEYAQVTQQISTNLKSAAQTAQADGNTTAANQLNQLASDFSRSSTSGQIPNIQDLAQAMGGHHHHHFPAEAADSASNVNSLFSDTQANGSATSALDPMAIISQTLTNAGINLAQ